MYTIPKGGGFRLVGYTHYGYWYATATASRTAGSRTTAASTTADAQRRR